MKVTESDLWQDKNKFLEEKEILTERLKYANNPDLITYTKSRLDIVNALLDYVNKLIGE